jgi:hypothetical protein
MQISTPFFITEATLVLAVIPAVVETGPGLIQLGRRNGEVPGHSNTHRSAGRRREGVE